MSTQTTNTTNKATKLNKLLLTAYRMEIETVANYVANSIHLDGMRAEAVKRSLREDVPEELGHAQLLANRLKQLGERIPGSLELSFDQESLRPPQSSTDLRAVIDGVLEAEKSAIDHYREIIDEAEATSDPVTADLATRLLADEEEHYTQFAGFKAELEDANCR